MPSEHRSRTTPCTRPASRKSVVSRDLARVVRHRAWTGRADGRLVSGLIRIDQRAGHHRRYRAPNRLAGAAGSSDVDCIRPRTRLPFQRHRDTRAGYHPVGIRAGHAHGWCPELDAADAARPRRVSRRMSTRPIHGCSRPSRRSWPSPRQLLEVAIQRADGGERPTRLPFMRQL